ncbi:MAG TPA: ABC transporter ATP-binding protein [Candidatus Saccharibacteria bacterium]|nr:ABC transporter ATP-binding protein [Candidatus Saccharibacteria bacterium]
MKLYSRTDAQTTRKTLAIFRTVLGEEKKRLVISSIFIPLQHLLYLVILPLFISLYVQSLLEHSFNTPYQLWLIIGMAVAGIGSLIAARIGFIAMFNHEEAMTTKLSEHAMRGLLSQSHTFFANSKVGALAGDVNTFSRSYLSLLDTVFLQASSIVVNFVASLIVVAFIAPIMLPVMIVLTYFVIALALRSYNRRSPLRNERKELQSKLMGTFGDIIGNQTLVRMFGRKDTEIHSVLEQRKKIEKIATEEIRILENGAELRLGVLVAFQIVVLVLCGWLLSIDMLTIAGLIFIVTYLGRVTGSLFAINGVVRTTEQAFLDASKITDILSKSVEVVDTPDAAKMEISDGTVEFRKVNFAYSDAKDQAIFRNFNLRIPGNQSIGLVGRSGGGKSTLTQLVLRYMDIQSGEITIDGQNIAHVTQDSLRKYISYVPQDPYLFHRTLRENIAYGKEDASDESIKQAAEQAFAMEFITKLPNGLDTVVGERGVKLSGGQRQRIAIARAILKDAPILLLDEATSALDSESEMYIQKALAGLMQGRTNIVIAHRLSTIAKLDRIIVLDDGKIIEDGTHKDLLKNNGVYAKLWKHQSGGFLEE